MVAKLRPFFDDLRLRLNSSSTFKTRITINTYKIIYCSRSTRWYKPFFMKLGLPRRFGQSKIVARAGKSITTFYIVKLAHKRPSITPTTAVIMARRSQYLSNQDKPHYQSIAEDLLCRLVVPLWQSYCHRIVKAASEYNVIFITTIFFCACMLIS